jgi:hypothetical protein
LYFFLRKRPKPPSLFTAHCQKLSQKSTAERRNDFHDPV